MKQVNHPNNNDGIQDLAELPTPIQIEMAALPDHDSTNPKQKSELMKSLT